MFRLVVVVTGAIWTHAPSNITTFIHDTRLNIVAIQCSDRSSSGSFRFSNWEGFKFQLENTHTHVLLSSLGSYWLELHTFWQIVAEDKPHLPILSIINHQLCHWDIGLHIIDKLYIWLQLAPRQTRGMNNINCLTRIISYI